LFLTHTRYPLFLTHTPHVGEVTTRAVESVCESVWSRRKLQYVAFSTRRHALLGPHIGVPLPHEQPALPPPPPPFPPPPRGALDHALPTQTTALSEVVSACEGPRSRPTPHSTQLVARDQRQRRRRRKRRGLLMLCSLMPSLPPSSFPHSLLCSLIARALGCRRVPGEVLYVILEEGAGVESRQR
jgi:hypothetical protein